jgi:hypothetical protein
MMHLVCGHAGSGSTSYLIKLASDESAKGHRVLFVSPEYNIEDISKRMYAYGKYSDITPSIDIKHVPFSKQSMIMIYEYLRGRELYDTIIIDCARALLDGVYDDVFHEIRSICGKLILGMQLNRHANTRDMHNIHNSILSNISAYTDRYTVIERISEPLNNGLSISIMNVSTSGRDFIFNDVESFMISTIKYSIKNITIKAPIMKLI